MVIIRGIALLVAGGKIFIRIIWNRLMTRDNLYLESQSASLQEECVEQQIYLFQILIDLW